MTVPIRDAATIILVKDPKTDPKVLMGMRGSKAVFMPNKFVFPGGAVDASDHAIPLVSQINATCAARLGGNSFAIAAAIRELWEETGLALGTPADWPDAPADWADFANRGLRPSADSLRYVFRAVTPVGRPRRFDARFFIADAGAIAGDINDFSAASDELSNLQWIPIADTKDFDLPFITQVVLAEITPLLRTQDPPSAVPFFKNNDEESLFLRLEGQA